ncbi:IS30 family transposase, partial [Enterococcus alcedinis]
YSKDYINTCIEKLNKRPRKCLGWKTPYELFFGKVLRLI